MESRTAESGRGSSSAPKQRREMPLGQPWTAARLRAAILLGGTVRPSVFGAGIRRSMLDLPVSANQTLLDYWGREFAEVARGLGLPKLAVRLVIGRNGGRICFRAN